MTIWNYVTSENADLTAGLAGRIEPTAGLFPPCMFCRLGLRLLTHLGGTEVHVCDRCGWWLAASCWEDDEEEYYEDFEDGRFLCTSTPYHIHLSHGVLRDLSLDDIKLPTEELRTLLMLKYQDRHKLNPRRFEDVVGGVFKDFGYRVRVTSYSGDDGIDVAVLDHDRGHKVGIQVKRYKGKIEAEQIRSFCGALMLNRMTRGIYITTSDFTKGARKTAARLKKQLVPIELWDANTFFDKLELAQRPRYTAASIRDAAFYGFLNGDVSVPLVRTHYVYNGRLDAPESDDADAHVPEKESAADSELADLFKAYLDSKRREKDEKRGKLLGQSTRNRRSGARANSRTGNRAGISLNDAVYGLLQCDPGASPDDVVKIFKGATKGIGKRRTVDKKALIRGFVRMNKKLSPEATIEALSRMGVATTAAAIKAAKIR